MRITPNQVVALNLRRARVLRGWTQMQAAERLEPFLGQRWSKATFSAAERSFDHPERIRQFTADEMTAFSAAFELPVPFFFLPPDEPNDVEPVYTEFAAPGAANALGKDELRKLAVAGTEEIREAVAAAWNAHAREELERTRAGVAEQFNAEFRSEIEED